MTNNRRRFLSGAGLAAVSLASAEPVLAQADLMKSDLSAQQGTGPTNAADPPTPNAVRALSVINLRELETTAEKIIPRGNFDYIAGAAGDEWTKAENETAFKRVTIAPRYLTGNAKVDMSTTLLGSKVAMPVIVSAMGGHGIAHVSAEVGTAKGADAVGVLMTSPTLSTVAMEDIAAAMKGPRWFQVYLPEDRGVAREILTRAKASGHTAMILTVDAFAPSNRERNTRNHYRGGPVGNYKIPAQAKMKFDLGWNDVDFIREVTGLPILLKGVMTVEMAREAQQHGVAGLQVSNHGGRQLDDVPAAITVLPAIADAVGDKMTLVIDGGVRRGQDVFKALALGADAVALGRPILYGLALGGWMGVQAVLERLRAELEMTMQLAGVKSISEITKARLYQA